MQYIEKVEKIWIHKTHHDGIYIVEHEEFVRRPPEMVSADYLFFFLGEERAKKIISDLEGEL